MTRCWHFETPRRRSTSRTARRQSHNSRRRQVQVTIALGDLYCQLWRRLLLRLQSQDPKSRIDIRDKDVAVSHHRPPRKRRPPVPQRIDSEDPAHLAALTQQVAFQLTGDIEGPRAALVIAEVERIAHDP